MGHHAARGLRVGACLLVVIVGSTALAEAADATEDVRPLNVLFLIADDLNTDLGCYSHPLVNSPNIDRLAERGVRFNQAYCQFPLCNPSRASFLTGRRPDTTGVYENATHFRANLPDVATLPQHFQDHGYFVARVGKLYHYGVPGQIGTPGLDDPPSWLQTVNPIGVDKAVEDRIFSLVPGQFGGTLSWLALPNDAGTHTDQFVAESAIRLLEAHKGEPFFLAVGFYRPHTPYVAPQSYFDRYPIERIHLPQNIEEDRADIPPPALANGKEYPGTDPELLRQAKQAYFASTTFMDDQVGRVLDALDRLGLAERTVVVFTSDHGYQLGEHGLWQKMSLFERAARVPLIIRTPGMKAAGQATECLAEMIDLYPTLSELCGLPAPKGTQGVSLAALIDDPNAAAPRTAALTQVRRGGGRNAEGFMGYSLRTERWRYTEWDDGRRGVELYDHMSDPDELTNLAEHPDHAGTVAELRETLRRVVSE